MLCSTDQLSVEAIRNCDMPFFEEHFYLQERIFILLRFLRKVVLDIRNLSLYFCIVIFLLNNKLVLVLVKKN